MEELATPPHPKGVGWPILPSLFVLVQAIKLATRGPEGFRMVYSKEIPGGNFRSKHEWGIAH